jgi:antitoxin VapB
LEIEMSKEYRAKVFKSGNSVALRLPKALGLKDGDEMVLREERSKFSFEAVDQPKRKIDISKFVGKAPWLKVPVRKDFDDPPRAWDHPDWPDFSK